jgi:hypothetical protein
MAGLREAGTEKAAEGLRPLARLLVFHRLLDATATLAKRVTPKHVLAYFNELRALRNADYTIVGRFAELVMALGILAPRQDFVWLIRPMCMIAEAGEEA